MNLVMLVLTLGSTEIFARLLSKQTAAGETVLGVLLYPKQWSQFAAYHKKVIDEIAHEGSYVVYDPILGWTVAPSRSDETGYTLAAPKDYAVLVSACRSLTYEPGIPMFQTSLRPFG